MILSITKGLAISASLLAGGAMSVASLMTIPALLIAPHNIAAKQFRLLHSIGQVAQPATAVVAAGLHGYVAYRLYNNAGGTLSGSGFASRWAVSAGLMTALLVWTFGLMEPTSRQLLAIAGTRDAREGGTQVAEKEEGLMRRWRALNVVRSGLAIGAGVVGLWTVMEE